MKRIEFRFQRQNNLNNIFYDDKACNGNGRRFYAVCKKEEPQDTVLLVNFQHGARTADEPWRDGVLDNDLLEIVRSRLSFFLQGEFATMEAEHALRHVEEALMWLAKRADDSAERGVLGTNNV